MHNLGDVYPIVLCDGYCGVGISKEEKSKTPYFYVSSFDSKEQSYFQPEHYFKLEDLPPQTIDNPILSTKESPSTETFTSAIEHFKMLPKLEKIVLARSRTHTFKNPISPLEILSLMKTAFPRENSYVYIKDKETAFIGSSPENLYKRDGNTIYVDCIAGTACGDEPLFTEKNIKEHEFVVTLVKEALLPITKHMSTSQKSVKKAGQLNHIHQTVTATLLDNISDQDLIDVLHPTPAVLGYPRELAKTFLKEHEHFDRGFYAGPIGWIAEEKALIKVAIRSGLIERNNLTLFAGAGIIEESIAEDEIKEIENKFNTLEGAFLENTMSH